MIRYGGVGFCFSAGAYGPIVCTKGTRAMANDYLPRKEAKALQWMESFAANISANPPLYMLTPADAASIQGAVDLFAAAFFLGKAPGTATRVTVLEKDQARVAAEQICRQYYSLIKLNAGISDSDKVGIGVRPLNRGRRPINCPMTSPALNILAATPGRQTLFFRDSLSPDSGGKPFGAIHLQLFVALGEAKSASRESARFYGTFTRNPMTVKFDQGDDGRVATYFGRWASRRNQVGPWSLPVSMRVAA
jgi:hypothetical protein